MGYEKEISRPGVGDGWIASLPTVWRAGGERPEAGSFAASSVLVDPRFDAPETTRCSAGNQWTGGVRSLTYRGRARRLRWLWLPVDLFREVHGRRSMVPVPLTYVMALVVGGVLGAAIDLVLGWSWWLVAAGFLAAVWLFFFASALWGPGSIHTDHLVDVINPQGAEARQ